MRGGLLRTTSFSAVALLMAPMAARAQLAPNAAPTGGTVVAGSASIGQSQALTQVNQASQRAAIDWTSFNVGSQHTVAFQQPNASAVTLNRVTGPDPSQIAGRIQANGQVVITNQSGIFFHKGAQVDTAGLVASAPGITNGNFMAGRMVFDQAPKPGAVVSNAGTITVSQAGLAALVAPEVRNSGVIQAKLGRAVLAGAERATLDLYGDGLVSIDVTGQVKTGPKGGQALVTNTGTIQADGGTVLLTAAAADGVVTTLVQAGGRIQANTEAGKAGRIEIAGVGGALRIEGRVAADGPAGAGGTVLAHATGGVTVAGGARVTANGATGGGSVQVGSKDGGATTIAAGARLSASARRSGPGGSVSVLSGATTRFDGSIFARAGRESGDGGQVEVSGRSVALAGRIDAGAPKGGTGRILLDPTDVTIGNDPGDVTPASLQAMTGDVTVQADNSVTAAASVALTGAEQSFTLQAGNLIRVNAGVTLSTANGAITLTTTNAGALVDLRGNLSPGGDLVFNGAATITQAAGSIVTVPTGSTLYGTVGSLSLTNPANSIAQVSGILKPLDASAGGISITSGTPMAIALVRDGGISVPGANTVTLQSDGLSLIGTAPGAAISAGTIVLSTLTANSGLTLTAGTAAAGTAKIDTGLLGDLQAPTLRLVGGNLGVNVNANAATLDFGSFGYITNLVVQSTGPVTQTGAIAVSDFSGFGTSLTLGATNNFIPTLSGFTATAGDVFFHTGEGLTVSGAVSGNNVALSSGGEDGPPMVLQANISAPGGQVRLDTFNGDVLSTSGAVQQSGGVITAATLAGEANGFSLGQQNQIGSLGALTSAGNLSIVNAQPLDIAGAVTVDGTTSFTVTGALTESTGSLDTLFLQGSAQSAALTSTANRVYALDGFTTSVGGFSLTATGKDGPLQVVAPVSVPAGQTLTLTSNDLRLVTDYEQETGTTSGTLTGTTVVIQPLTAGTPLEFASTQTAGSLSLSQDQLLLIQAGTFQFGSAIAGPILMGKAGDAFDLRAGVGALQLVSAGAVTQGTGATLAVPALGVSAASVNLPDGNPIATLNQVTVTGDATVNSGTALTVAQPLSAATATISSAGLLTVNAGMTAPTLSLAGGAGGIALSGGPVTASNSLRLTTTGPVTQSAGVLNVGTLTGTAASVALTNADNLVVNLGDFSTTGPFALTDNRGLTVTGLVTPADTSLTVNGGLAVDGTLSTGTLTLAVTGGVTVGTGGTVGAGTLQGSAGSVLLDRGTTVGTLAGFQSSTGFTLVDGGPLTVTGPLSDGASIALTGQAGFAPGAALTVAGDLSAPVIRLTALRNSAPTAPQPGNLQQTGGTIAGTSVVLTAQDAIGQTGGQIVAATLSATGGTTVRLPSATNQTAQLVLGSGGGEFTLNTAGALDVAGPVTDTASVGLTSGGPMTLAATLTAPAMRLTSGGALTQTAGYLGVTGTLTGSAAGAAALTAAGNQVARLGAFSAGGPFALTDSVPLTVTGTVASPTLVQLLSDSIGLDEGGLLSSPAGQVTLAPATAGAPFSLASLVASGATSAVDTTLLQVGVDGTGPISVAGTFNFANVDTLAFRSAGAVTETAGSALTVDRLNLAVASAALGGPNHVGTLGPVTAAGDVQVANAQDLALAGPATVGGTLRLDVTGALTLAGTATANAAVLNATGAIAQPGGGLAVGTLSGSAASAVLESTANRVGTLGAFASGGAFSLQAGSPLLTVTGPVSGGTSVTLANAGGGLAIGGPVTAPAVRLTAATSIVQGAGGALSVSGVLSGSAGGPVSLAGANAVAALGPFSSSGGFVLGTTGSLRVAGPLTDTARLELDVRQGDLAVNAALAAPAVALNVAGAITQGGTGGIATALLSGQAGSVLLTGGGNQVAGLGAFASTQGGFALQDGASLAIGGPVSAATAIGIATAGDLAVNGMLRAPSATLSAAGAITEGLSGMVNAGTLTGSSGGPAALTSANQVGTLGAFSSGSSFALTSRSPLTVNGAVQASGTAPTITLLSDSIGLGPLGSLTALGGTVALGPATPGSVFSLASLVAGGAPSAVQASTLQVGTPSTGSVVVDGVFSFPNVDTLAFRSAGAVTETPGSAITANRLELATGGAALAGANQIGTLGTVLSSGGVQLTNAQGLTVAGPVTLTGPLQLDVAGPLALAGTIVGTDAVVLNATGAITQPGGAILARSLSGTAASAALTGQNQVGTLAGFSSSGGFVLNQAGGLTVAGPVTDATSVRLNSSAGLVLAGTVAAPAVTLNAGGSIVQSSGAILAGSLSGTAASAALTSPQNRVGALGPFLTTDAFTLTNGQSLTVAGLVDPPAPVTLTVAGDLVLNAPIVGSVVTLNVAGAVSQSAQGGITAASLTGSAGSLALTGPGNAVGTLAGYGTLGALALTDGVALTQTGTVQAGGPLQLSTSGALTLSGTLSAPTVSLRGAGPVVLGNSQIVANSLSVEAVAQGAPLDQVGTLAIVPASATRPAVALIVHGGRLTLAGLQAAAADVTLSLDAGQAIGALDAGSLTVLGTGGGAALTGTVAGQGGFPAAYAARIAPRFDPAYLLNGCPIASVACGVQPPAPVQVAVFPSTIRPDILAQLSLFQPYLLTQDLVTIDLVPAATDPAFVLPNISDRDY